MRGSRRWAGAVLRELAALFVDDARLAVLAGAWLVVVWCGVPRLGMAPGWAGLVLFAGLAAILVESACRRARQHGSASV